MKSTDFGSTAFINSAFIIRNRNLTFSGQSEDYVKTDDFQNIFNSVGVKIFWILNWIVFESFTNITLYFIIMFEKYGG